MTVELRRKALPTHTYWEPREREDIIVGRATVTIVASRAVERPRRQRARKMDQNFKLFGGPADVAGAFSGSALVVACSAFVELTVDGLSETGRSTSVAAEAIVVAPEIFSLEFAMKIVIQKMQRYLSSMNDNVS